jgi:hypothetical protein
LEEAKAQFQKSWHAWKALAKLKEVAESRLAPSTNLQNSHSPPQRFAGEVVAHVAQVELDQQIAHLGFADEIDYLPVARGFARRLSCRAPRCSFACASVGTQLFVTMPTTTPSATPEVRDDVARGPGSPNQWPGGSRAPLSGTAPP